MRPKIALVGNVRRFIDAYDAIEQRDIGIEGMCLVYGATGAGKTKALTYLMNQRNAIYAEASPSWTLTSMLATIVRALGAEPKGRAADMEAFIVDQMAIENRPLFIDELDHMLLPGQATTLRMLESLRSIYDKSKMPVVMVGMDKIDRKIRLREQLSRRIFQWIKFEDLNVEDARILADTCSEVRIADDWLTDAQTATQGRIGRLYAVIAHAERRAKANGWPEINKQLWGDNPLPGNGT